MIIATATGLLPNQALYARIFYVLIYRGWLVVGTAMACALLTGFSAKMEAGHCFGRDTIRSFIGSPQVLKGICLSVVVSFVGTEIGKLAHDSEMRQFFVQSGYPVWFLYFIIASETLGSLGLLISRTILPAAAWLAVLMIGAILTHAHNHDPFADSLEALHLLILLTCVIVIRVFRARTAPTHAVEGHQPISDENSF